MYPRRGGVWETAGFRELIECKIHTYRLESIIEYYSLESPFVLDQRHSRNPLMINYSSAVIALPRRLFPNPRLDIAAIIDDS